MMRRRALLLILLIAPLALAGCTGDDGGNGDGGEARLATCPEPVGDLELRIVVDQSQPEPGDPLHLSLYLENRGDEPVNVPSNLTVEVARDDTLNLVMEWRHVEPRFDINDTVQPGESLFYKRVGDEFPPGAEPGDYVVCGSGGTGEVFHGVKPFRVYPTSADG